jgi:hypothetical protein
MTRLKELLCVLTWHRWHTHNVSIGYKALEAHRYEVVAIEEQHCHRCEHYRLIDESLGEVAERPERGKQPMVMSPGPDPKVWN